MKHPCVYIITNLNRTTLYIGVTNDIERRMLEHKGGVGSTFTSKYNLTDLMHFEEFKNMSDAIEREKQLKNWHKDWKWNLIKEKNTLLKDLSADWFTTEEIAEAKVDFEEEYREND